MLPNFSQAAISFTNGRWENSFACNDWVHTYPFTVDCAGLENGLNYCATSKPVTERQLPCDGTDQSRSESILHSMNNPGGVAGTAAQVHYFYTGVNGSGESNDVSGGLNIVFPALLQEYWFRSYIYYPRELGWGIQNGWKTFYFDTVAGLDGWYFDFPQNSETGFYFQTKDANGQNIGYVKSVGYGDPWLESNNRQGFGRWIPIEIHAKNGTTRTNGVLQVWVDGVLILDKRTQDFGMDGFRQIRVGSNGNAAIAAEPSAINKAVPIGFDDMVISTTDTNLNTDAQNNKFIGPIGWVNGGDATAPSAPIGLSIQ